ncbi:uncharacterized protein C2orf74 homolog [Talpa occidentalis]|uniref:uncharacterized protein C2orf74 homolog n=1 Tax=Talpa occidentalis TaxID=50954 RepID=UPI00188F87E0|nr:uncharacterized protein C2orf74 homolog [Talpa occidentalis]
MSLLTNLMRLETTANTFFTILLLCLICIFLLLVAFLYKCFQIEKPEDSENIPCTDGRDCLAANVEKSNLGDQGKTPLKQPVDLNMPPRPGILVQRHSKESVPISTENKVGDEDKTEEKQDAEDGDKDDKEDQSLHKPPSAAENHKRPLKGVTFSKEVIVVDLGKSSPIPRSYTRQHKERK